MRWSRCELQRGESSRGKQQNSKLCHDDPGPGKGSWGCAGVSGAIEQALGRIVAAFKREFGFISPTRVADARLFIAHSGDHFQIDVLQSSLLFQALRLRFHPEPLSANTSGETESRGRGARTVLVLGTEFCDDPFRRRYHGQLA